jgi:hypothetical protein
MVVTITKRDPISVYASLCQNLAGITLKSVQDVTDGHRNAGTHVSDM